MARETRDKLPEPQRKLLADVEKLFEKQDLLLVKLLITNYPVIEVEFGEELAKQADGPIPGIPNAASPPNMPGLGPDSAAQSTPLTPPKPGLTPKPTGPGPGIALPPKPPAGPGPGIAKPPMGGMPDIPVDLPGKPPAAPQPPVPTPGAMGGAAGATAGGASMAGAGPAGSEADRKSVV